MALEGKSRAHYLTRRYWRLFPGAARSKSPVLSGCELQPENFRTNTPPIFYGQSIPLVRKLCGRCSIARGAISGIRLLPASAREFNRAAGFSAAFLRGNRSAQLAL